MKILLLGEFSGLHWNLAEGLRALGHDVCVASDGCGWRNYPRDIALDRPTDSLRDGICCLLRILRHLPGFRGYDVVQIISPYFCVYAVNVLCLFTVICNGTMARSFWELSGPTIIIFVLVWKQALFTIRILRSETGIVIRLLIRLLSRIGIMGGSSCHSGYSRNL